MTLTCDYCGKVYESYQCGKYNHFCSIECRRLGAKLISANITQEDRKRRSEQITRIDKTINCRPDKIEKRLAHYEDRTDYVSYRKRNGRHEHRIVAEEMLGRPLHSNEVVHHIDGDKRNNDPANLRVMTQSEHIALHLTKGGGRL